VYNPCRVAEREPTTSSLSGSSIIFTAPAQNNNAARNFTGTITVKSIAYQESDGQNFLVFEYRR
jgi:hypothetical protein